MASGAMQGESLRLVLSHAGKLDDDLLLGALVVVLYAAAAGASCFSCPAGLRLMILRAE